MIAVTLLQKKYIEDITRWRGDLNFIFECQNNALGRKTLFLPRENKIHIFKPPCNVLLSYRQKDIDKIIEGNHRNYVIDKLGCEIMENKPTTRVPGVVFMNFTSGIFSSKTLVSI